MAIRFVIIMAIEGVSMTLQTSPGEWIEIEALRAVHEAAGNDISRSLGMRLVDVNGICCSISSKDPTILINRCFGLGEPESNGIETILEVKQLYRQAGVAEFFLHLVPGSYSGAEDLLQAAGMKQNRGWMKFSRDMSPLEARPSSLQIIKALPEHGNAFGTIVAPCFDMLENSIPVLGSLPGHPDWHVYLGFDGERPVATGALFVRDGIGYYDWAATHQDFRKRGYQGAILAHLINEAGSLGCSSLYTATGEAVPGDPQHSYHNILRYGFEEEYLRENWVPDNSSL